MNGLRSFMSLIGAAGAGIAGMYYLDPQHGTRRRARARDALRRAFGNERDLLGKAAKDLRNRAAGLAAKTGNSHEPVTDRQLEQRIRSRLGRLVSHPGSVEVTVRAGRVTLAGPVMEDEKPRLLQVVQMMEGVTEIESRLVAHRVASSVPGLQGGRMRSPRPQVLQENWTPALRVAGSGAGLGLLAYGLSRRGVVGLGSAVAGGALLTRAMTNLPARRLLGIGVGAHAVEVRKTLRVHVPVEEAYEILRHVERYPAFMEHVTAIESSGDDRMRWTVAGPAGIPIQFETRLTEQVPQRRIAWSTEPGGVVEHEGSIRFEPAGEATRIHVHMSYCPPGGVVGHTVARFLRADLKSVLDDDLGRLKTLLEEGASRVHGQRITRNEAERKEETR